MLKKTIKFTDFDGNDTEETFYFNLTRAELIELEVSQQGGLESYLRAIIKSEDNGEIFHVFKKILLMSVGARSSDGRKFYKNDDIRADFEASPAFDELIISFIDNEKEGSDFINAILPTIPVNQERLPLPDGE